jgi:D-alanyl-lipoteichoic acid acyltransferase DltB (MBOAT superfamily)
MTIVSFRFAAFTACALLAYHALPARLRVALLLVFSYAFCAALGYPQLAILIALTAGNFAIGTRVAAGGSRRRVWLWSGIALNVAMLLALRAFRSGGPAIIAGLSFYSLQAISYLADTYSGALRAQPAFATFALYLAYFPKLLAGPIERPRAFFERLSAPKPVDDTAVAEAATLIATGMVRKLVIADPLAALLPASAFASPLTLSPGAKAYALAVFGFVLYNDFAGYTAIVRGVSRLFGIELSPNFVRPFFAATFAEFWTRWHISLSNWLRDYIYMPVSRSLLRRNSSLRNVPNLVLPPMAAMLGSGVWHGGSANMMIWGGVHGAYLSAERVAGVWGRRRPPGRPQGWRRVLRIAMVFTLANASLAFFRMETGVALRFFITMFTGLGTESVPAQTLLLMAPSLWLDWMQSRYGDEHTFDHWPPFARSVLLACVLLLCFLMSRTSAGAPFIYQAF